MTKREGGGLTIGQRLRSWLTLAALLPSIVLAAPATKNEKPAPSGKSESDYILGKDANWWTNLINGYATDLVDLHAADSSLAATHAADMRTLSNWIAQLVANSTDAWQDSTKKFVFEGDSNTAGTALGAGEDWPTQAMLLPQFAGRGTKLNVAQGGDKIADVIADYSAEVYPLRPTAGRRAFLFVAVGTNDMNGSSSAAELFAALTGYWAQAKTDGFTVVAFTIPGLELDGARQGVRQDLNRLIRASSVYDYLVDLDAYFPDPWDTGIFKDGTHFSANGAKKVASLVNSVLAVPRAHAAPQASPYMRYPSASYLRLGDSGWSHVGTLRLANGGTLSWRNAADTGDISPLYVAGDNRLWIGEGAERIVARTSILQVDPYADQSATLALNAGATAIRPIYLEFNDRSSIVWDIRKGWDNNFQIVDRVSGSSRLSLTASGGNLYQVGGAANHWFANAAGAITAEVPYTGGVRPGAPAAGGITGSGTIYSGTGVPGNANGNDGDFYFRSDTPGTANQRLYIRTGGAWVGIL